MAVDELCKRATAAKALQAMTGCLRASQAIFFETIPYSLHYWLLLNYIGDGLPSIKVSQIEYWRKVYRMVQFSIRVDPAFPLDWLKFSPLLAVARRGSSRRVEHFIHLWWHLRRSEWWVVGRYFLWSSALQIASDCRSRSKSLGLWMQPHREWCLQGAILE